MDSVVKLKHFEGCKYLESKDKSLQAVYDCDINHSGSAGPWSFKEHLTGNSPAVDYKIWFTKLISDGESKTHALLLEEQPYDTEAYAQVQGG